MMIWTDIREIDSSDCNVKKYVFAKQDAVAESVLYKYPTYYDRTVICCSTQSGCPVGCRFCGAGDNFVRSLTTEEIVSQPAHLLASQYIDTTKVNRLQIMFMSMGEPLLNSRHLFPAIRELHYRYPHAALLISTSAPRVDYEPLRLLSQEIPTVGLQFSVHESTDFARNLLVPFKAKLSLYEIADEGELWFEATGRQPFFNYCVHERNNTPDDVARLTRLFRPGIWQATISVICEREESIAAANQRQRELAANFMDLMQTVGYSTRMFDPAGQDDIGGGCGQLWYVQDWMRRHPDLARPSIGNGPMPAQPPPGYYTPVTASLLTHIVTQRRERRIQEAFVGIEEAIAEVAVDHVNEMIAAIMGLPAPSLITPSRALLERILSWPNPYLTPTPTESPRRWWRITLSAGAQVTEDDDEFAYTIVVDEQRLRIPGEYFYGDYQDQRWTIDVCLPTPPYVFGTWEPITAPGVTTHPDAPPQMPRGTSGSSWRQLGVLPSSHEDVYEITGTPTLSIALVSNVEHDEESSAITVTAQRHPFGGIGYAGLAQQQLHQPLLSSWSDSQCRGTTATLLIFDEHLGFEPVGRISEPADDETTEQSTS